MLGGLLWALSPQRSPPPPSPDPCPSSCCSYPNTEPPAFQLIFQHPVKLRSAGRVPQRTLRSQGGSAAIFIDLQGLGQELHAPSTFLIEASFSPQSRLNAQGSPPAANYTFCPLPLAAKQQVVVAHPTGPLTPPPPQIPEPGEPPNVPDGNGANALQKCQRHVFARLYGSNQSRVG